MDTGCFQISAILNNAAKNMGVHTFLWIGVLGFLGYIPTSGTTVSKGSSIFNFFEETQYCFPEGLYQSSFPMTVH